MKKFIWVLILTIISGTLFFLSLGNDRDRSFPTQFRQIISLTPGEAFRINIEKLFVKKGAPEKMIKEGRFPIIIFSGKVNGSFVFTVYREREWWFARISTSFQVFVPSEGGRIVLSAVDSAARPKSIVLGIKPIKYIDGTLSAQIQLRGT